MDGLNQSRARRSLLTVFGKEVAHIKHLLIACHKQQVPVRISPSDTRALRALKSCDEAVRQWAEHHRAYRELTSASFGQASASPTGSPTPMRGSESRSGVGAGHDRPPTHSNVC